MVVLWPGDDDSDVEIGAAATTTSADLDPRVLVRVYASPTDGRSGGGYVQYTLAGAFVKTTQ